MVQRLLARLDDLGLLGSSPLVGLSGGADSTALAIGMGELARSGRLRPRLAHIEHRVRGGSGHDVTIVLGTAERLALPLSVRAIPEGAIASHAGSGPEEAMRRERYRLFAHVASETSCAAVVTAHHAEDQAETVLAHLIRGSGLDGAAGIRPSTTLTVPWWPSPVASRPLVVIRPLLSERRRDLAALVSDLGMAVVVDQTNRDVDRTRAALRHRVLPVLEEIHPDAAVALSRFAEVTRAAVNELAPVADTVRLDRELRMAGFGGLSVAAQRLSIREWVVSSCGCGLTFARTEAIRRWVVSAGVGTLEIGGGWSIRRAGRTIKLHDDVPDRRRATT